MGQLRYIGVYAIALMAYWCVISLIFIGFTGKTYEIFTWYWVVLIVISVPTATFFVDKFIDND